MNGHLVTSGSKADPAGAVRAEPLVAADRNVRSERLMARDTSDRTDSTTVLDWTRPEPSSDLYSLDAPDSVTDQNGGVYAAGRGPLGAASGIHSTILDGCRHPNALRSKTLTQRSRPCRFAPIGRYTRMMMMIGFTTHLSPARHLVNVTPSAAHPGSGGTLVKISVKANSGDHIGNTH